MGGYGSAAVHASAIAHTWRAWYRARPRALSQAGGRTISTFFDATGAVLASILG